MSLEAAARTVLFDCLGVQRGENVLILSDPARRRIADALVEQAREAGAETVWMEMSQRPNNGAEPPPSVASAMLKCDVFIAPTTMSVSHTAARKAANAAGARAATMPQITEDMLVRTMRADYGLVKKRSEALAAALTAGETVHIATERGTDVTLSIAGREGISDGGDITTPGAFGNLPAGEGFIAPVEGSTNGTIVVDGTIYPLGLLDEPLVFEVTDGYISDMRGPRAEEFRAWLEPHGRAALAVAELGIGTNEAAQLTGNVLEDEKIAGTVHIAFGDNHSFGGTNRVASHEDGIILKPTLTIDGKEFLADGKLLV